jgi:hypothetical protein
MTHHTQTKFDETYITSAEIAAELKISRTAIIYARRRNVLPSPIIIQGSKTHLWLRKEVTPILRAWKAKLYPQAVNAA